MLPSPWKGWLYKLIQAELLQWLIGSCWRWPDDCSWSPLTALLLGRLLDCLLFTDARTMRHALQWSSLKPESGSGWFAADLHWSLVSLIIMLIGSWAITPSFITNPQFKVKVILRPTASHRLILFHPLKCGRLAVKHCMYNLSWR
jgi:hypothetical protein